MANSDLVYVVVDIGRVGNLGPYIPMKGHALSRRSNGIRRRYMLIPCWIAQTIPADITSANSSARPKNNRKGPANTTVKAPEQKPLVDRLCVCPSSKANVLL